jgi:uncharacterized protein YecE (DUF72 family)
MNVRVGTSGYSFAPWKGFFYPKDLPASKMLAFYGTKLGTVEINNTFYKLPSEKTVAAWAAAVPEGFSFAVKASQYLTHRRRLREPEEPVARIYGLVAHLGAKRGPILVQVPPNMKKDLARLTGLLDVLPEGHRAALELRHESWFDDEVLNALHSKGAALVCSDTDDVEGKLVETAPWGYLRLRRTEYDEKSLAKWAERVRSLSWTDAWVFFKHEEEGLGPRLAARFGELFAGAKG